MLAFDRIHRQTSGRGNVCALVYQFSSREAASRVLNRVVTNPTFIFLRSLYLQRQLTGWVWKKRFQNRDLQHLPAVQLEKISDLYSHVAKRDLDPANSPAFDAELVSLGTAGAALIFYWQHTLTDARGGEIITSALVSGREISGKELHSTQNERFSFSTLKQIKSHIFSTCQTPRSSFCCTHTDTKSASSVYYRYRRLELTVEETAKIDENCRSLKAEVFRSSVYLAAVARSCAQLQISRGENRPTFFLSVPHNLRRVNKLSGIGNRVSFLFYRIPFEALSERATAVRFLVDYSLKLIEQGLHHSCESLHSAIKRMPLWLTVKLLSRPSGGTFASFYFSDTGELKTDLDFDQLELKEIFHLPPNFSPPGFTTVFTRSGGRLSAMIVAAFSSVSDLELDQFTESLRHELLYQEAMKTVSDSPQKTKFGAR